MPFDRVVGEIASRIPGGRGGGMFMPIGMGGGGEGGEGGDGSEPVLLLSYRPHNL